MATLSKRICARTRCFLSDSLLSYIVERTSRFPGAVFWEFEVRQRFGDAVDRIVAARLLRPLAAAPGQLFFPCRPTQGCQAAGREIVETGGKIWAVCNCPVEEPPQEIRLQDLQRHSLCGEQFAKALATKNGLQGQPKQLDSRLWFLGDSQADGQSSAWVWALLRDDGSALSLVESLLPQLPSIYKTVVVLASPVYLPPDAVVLLNGLGLFILPVPTDTDLQVPAERLATLNARRASEPATWPDDFFKDEDGVWLNAKILSERFSIPDSRLKDWRETGCPDLGGQKLAAKKIGGEGWVYLRMHVNQIANRRDDKGKVEAKLNLEARLGGASTIKREQVRKGKARDSR
jgi:hypothetical protein